MSRLRPIQTQRGFTLIELLIAITLMAVLAGLSWRGLDSLMRTRDITQVRVNQTALLQTVLDQWHADLDAIQPVPSINGAGISWNGQTLLITRRATTLRPDGGDAGLWVIGWTLRNNQWVRWQSPPLQTRNALQQAWSQAERWGQNTSSDDASRETLLIPVDAWQLTYFRGNAWTNPLSSAGGVDANNSGATAVTPDAIRLQMDLPASSGLRGRLTLDWVRPNFSNTKT